MANAKLPKAKKRDNNQSGKDKEKEKEKIPTGKKRPTTEAKSSPGLIPKNFPDNWVITSSKKTSLPSPSREPDSDGCDNPGDPFDSFDSASPDNPFDNAPPPKIKPPPIQKILKIRTILAQG